MRVGFRPRTCGTHELFVGVHGLGGDTADLPRKRVILEVDCDSPPDDAGQDDDGCEIATAGPSSKAWLVILAGVTAFVMRPRGRRPVGATMRSDRRRLR